MRSPSDLYKLYKACIPYSIINFFFELHLYLSGVWLRLDVRKDTNEIVPKITRLHAENLLTNLCSIMNVIGKTYMTI